MSRLRFANVEYSDRSTSSRVQFDAEHSGGGLSFNHSDAEVERSTIRFNSAAIGGGVYIGPGSAVSITDSAIHSNVATGALYIFSGGGGVYVESSSKTPVTLARNVIALNRFLAGSYPNEEGGGGLYLNSGSASVFFNLFLANRSGKGPGALLLPRSGQNEQEGLPFFGNLFIANNGAFNFEQVAIQTRYTFEDASLPNVWAENTGQFPFVAHLVRNSLVRYVNYGQKLPMRRLLAGGEGSEDEVRFLSGAWRPRETVLITLRELSSLAQVCDGAVSFGPLRRCRNSTSGNLQAYLRESLETSSDRALYDLFKAEIGATPNKTATQRAVELVDYARAAEPGEPERPPLPAAFEQVANGENEPATLLAAIKDTRTTDGRGLGPALWLFQLGHDSAFDNLLANADNALVTDVLQQAAKERFEDAALRVLGTQEVTKPAISRRILYECFGFAAETGQSRLVKTLLDRGVDPNLPYLGRYPLARAAEGGHVDTVILLLRRGAVAVPATALLPDGTTHPRPLYEALKWYHLGGGFQEIVELLIAAGADFEPDAPPELERPDALRLQSWITAGLPSGGALFSALLAQASKTAQGEHGRAILARLTEGQVTPDPIVSAIRRFRSLSVEEVITRIDSGAAENELIALYRILGARRFVTKDSFSRVVWSRFDPTRYPRLVAKVRLDYVLALHQEGPLSSVTPKGGKPGGAGVVVDARPSAVAPLPYRRKLAIVIGISDYERLPASRAEASPDYEGLIDLSYAAKDAEDVARLIRADRFGPGWEVVELIGPMAKRAQVDAALKVATAKVDQDDLVLLFFSGHGWAASQASEQAFLLLQDSDLTNLETSALRLRALREWALGLKANHVVLLLDACRSGLLGAAKGQAGSVSYQELETGQRTATAGKIALTSSLGGDLSYEDKHNQNGFFTRFLIQVIEGGLARPRSGSILSVREVYEALLRAIPEAVNQSRRGVQQLPSYIWLAGSDLLDFPLIPIR
ncbi:caspase family protein [Reyranella soli]|uniref:caspase family protein n=1 Tax=Reyranella soli TaxID=1230389 RepID=UPI00147877EC|nr:caspase family protein [Reyranella soli]